MVRFLINPFTDRFDAVSLGAGTEIDFITGNSGGPVGPGPGNDINLLGDNTQGINIVGNPATFTLTVSGINASTSQIGVQADASNAQAAAQSATNVSLTPSNITSLFSTNFLPSSQGGTGLSSPAAHQLIVSNGSSPFTALGVASNGQIPIGSLASDPVLATITPSGSITVTNGPGSITIGVTGGGLAWSTISANQTLAVNNGYICVSPGGALALLLPPVSALGDVIRVTIDGSASFSITQGAGQQVRFGNQATTLGVGGSLTSTQQGDAIHLVCKTANLFWVALSSLGNPTVV